MHLRTLLILLAIISFSVEAQMYSWTDESGKKHFGDRVPPKYEKQADAITTKIHKPSEEDVQEAVKAHRDAKRFNEKIDRDKAYKERQQRLAERQRRMAERLRKQVQQSPTANQDHGNDNEPSQAQDYETRLAAYNDSIRCFEFCRIEIPEYTDGLRSGVHFDFSECGHCKELPKPKKYDNKTKPWKFTSK